MFLDLTSTAPVIDYRTCPKQLVIRVGDTDALEGLVADLNGEVFHPVAEGEMTAPRHLRVLEFRIQPQMFQDQDDIAFQFTAHSATMLRGLRLHVEMALSFDGVAWDFGLDVATGSEESGSAHEIRFWIPLPEYDPTCTEPTPLQADLDDTPRKPGPTAWQRLMEG